MKMIARYANRAEAEMVKGFLDAEGIPAYVSADDEGGLHPALGSMQGAKLLVPEEFFEDAQEVLETIDSAPPLLDLVDPVDE